MALIEDAQSKEVAHLSLDEFSRRYAANLGDRCPQRRAAADRLCALASVLLDPVRNRGFPVLNSLDTIFDSVNSMTDNSLAGVLAFVQVAVTQRDDVFCSAFFACIGNAEATVRTVQVDVIFLPVLHTAKVVSLLPVVGQLCFLPANNVVLRARRYLVLFLRRILERVLMGFLTLRLITCAFGTVERISDAHFGHRCGGQQTENSLGSRCKCAGYDRDQCLADSHFSNQHERFLPIDVESLSERFNNFFLCGERPSVWRNLSDFGFKLTAIVGCERIVQRSDKLQHLFTERFCPVVQKRLEWYFLSLQHDFLSAELVKQDFQW